MYNVKCSTDKCVYFMLKTADPSGCDQKINFQITLFLNNFVTIRSGFNNFSYNL